MSHHAPFLPRYGEGSLSDIIPFLCSPARRTTVPSWMPSLVDGAERVVLLLIDGLGWNQLTARPQIAPVISSMVGGPITSVAPSTTATALTSLTTGLTPGELEYLRTQAISRLYLDNFPNIQSSWVTQGLKIGQIALLYVANDMGSLMIEENVVAEAGTVHFLTLDEIRAAITELAQLKPKFFSVTYGAGGSTRQRTHETVARLKRETGIDAAAHLTCVAATQDEINEIARAYWDAGIRHIVALRGDPPGGMGGKYSPHPGGYANAAALVAGLKKIADFQISVAGYPEKHPDSSSVDADLANLKRKVDAGADRCITQFFFECDDFLRFRDKAAAFGINVPIVAGVMPVSNFQGIQRMAGLCGAKVPAWLADMFEGLDDDVETRRMIAATVAGDLCRRLHAEGVDQFHFYTLNRADLTFALCHLLGVRPARRPS